MRNLGLIKYLAIGEKGVGLALKSSWKQSQADILSCMDLDLSTNIRHIPEAIDFIIKNQCRLVKASL